LVTLVTFWSKLGWATKTVKKKKSWGFGEPGLEENISAGTSPPASVPNH
jgi:hypothetical protein